MKKVTLVCYGKLKTPGLLDAVSEFTKRLARYTEFQVVELKPMPVPEKSETLRSAIPEKEGEQLLELLASPSFKQKAGRAPEIWALDETGKPLKTTEWARAFQECNDRGPGEVVFLIGGSLGLGENILKAVNKRVSFGPQTVSHEIARLLLVEQVYRALSYLEGHPYHNEG